jgi:ribosomal-protein-serine acetyltransferase
MQAIVHQGIQLRPFDSRDAEAFATAARESAQTVGRWMPWCHGDYAAQDAQGWFILCQQGLVGGTSFECGIFSDDGAELLGGVGLNHFNFDHNFCNLGYWVRQSRHRQGVGLRAAQALAAYGFEDLDLTRIEIVVPIGNEPSRGMAMKLGAVFECVARNRLVIGGRPVPAWVHSLVPAGCS